MGGINTMPECCEICNLEYGETPIFKIHHHGNLWGHFFCSNCFLEREDYDLEDMENKLTCLTKSKKCFNCNYKNTDINSLNIFKVFWYGKYGEKYMCERCIYDKDYRKKVR